MSVLKTISAAAATAAMLGSSALAGSAETTAAESIVAPVTYAPVTGDWTGGYVGLQLGYADVSATGGLNGDGAIGGIIAGYDYDFGTWVLGGGLDYDFSNISIGGATTLENVARLKLRAGYDTGPGLVYATAGGAKAYTSTLGDDTGWFAGVGYEHMLGNGFSVGGEVLYHEFKNFNATGVNVDATTVQLRGAYRF